MFLKPAIVLEKWKNKCNGYFKVFFGMEVEETGSWKLMTKWRGMIVTAVGSRARWELVSHKFLFFIVCTFSPMGWYTKCYWWFSYCQKKFRVFQVLYNEIYLYIDNISLSFWLMKEWFVSTLVFKKIGPISAGFEFRAFVSESWTFDLGKVS